ncbi:hypothetical protein EIP91_000515 [Steccherinum ochraceum]|uniref:tRNA ligase n=1 Tax=Steccherinum ochraceum TaxID=92696 RepID=A0A4V2MXQ8_9APHY|nr:hypothetical protein EIP91_000515 [Steccherinum ochraceum]
MESDLASTFQKLSLSSDDDALVRDLFRISKKSPKLIRSSEDEAPADPRIKLRSWKMNEFKYYDIPSPFPTLARGLFTQEIKEEGYEQDPRNVKHRIVVRGYDKFFNIGEVPWTSWASLEQHTSPPYTLTLKSNGCIIFVAALTPKKLVVTSKHSLGNLTGTATESHAMVGARWLKKHLADAGKTEEQLAKHLWDKNWTAVAELCDDSFEEHVLPYSKDKTGLHLHGINSCTKEFHTQLQPVVDAFAREWGFIPTKSTVLPSIAEVKSFTEEIGKSGEWNGEALEGFVVRTHVSAQPPTKGSASADQSPYAPGSSFFFKVKFDEPYMMYRDWREVTKILLSKGAVMANVPKSKLRRKETKVYAEWVIREIQRDKDQFNEYQKGKGIIATRERFQKWLETEEGKKRMEGADANAGLQQTGGDEAPESKKFGKTIIVPVAIPGVGKTSLAVALKFLFGFGHTQSDDIQVRKAAPVFIKNVVGLLDSHDVVIADKNNHLRQHRTQLRDATKTMSPSVRLVALNWSHDLPPATIHRLCSTRIHSRGANHQTLRPDATNSYEDVLWMFLNQTQELQDDEVDDVIEMDLEEDLESALKRIVDRLVEILGLERPTTEKMGEAVSVIRGYAPSTSTTRELGKPSARQKASGPRYFGLVPEVDLQKLVGGLQLPESGKAFWEGLVKNKRLGERSPHVTIVHSKDLEGLNGELWNRCLALAPLNAPNTTLFSFRLGHLLWDGKVMAITITDLAVSTDEDVGDGEAEREKAKAAAVEFVVKLPEEIKQHLHLTVGTREKAIAPYEARLLVGRWRNGKKQGINEVELKDMWVKGALKGLFQ